MDMSEFHAQLEYLRRMREKILEKETQEIQVPKTALDPNIARAIELLITADQGTQEYRLARLHAVSSIIEKYAETLKKLED